MPPLRGSVFSFHSSYKNYTPYGICLLYSAFCLLPTALCLTFVTRLLPASDILNAMDALTPQLISSFIIRFVMEETSVESSAYHGSIRHIQTAEEINFNEWREATEFMHRFVQLEELQPPPSLESPNS